MEGGQVVPEWARGIPVKEVCTSKCDLTGDTGVLWPSGTSAGSTFHGGDPGLLDQSRSYTLGVTSIS